jgi:hypothetical protein
MGIRRYSVYTLALIALLIFSANLFGQASDGILVGSITDASGSAVVNAALQLDNVATGIRYSAKTDELGQYRFNNIPAGKYKLVTTAAGFGNTTVENINIEANLTATVNVSMQVGSLSESVSVIEAPAVIDTTTARLQTTFNTRQAEVLPTTGIGILGVINLSLLSAGVSSSGGAGYGTGPSIGGQRPTDNNFMIEGVDDNNRSVTGPQISVSNEAVAEFTLQQNQFSPEFGHSTGGQFNTIIKSGTNELHGTLYEYFQNRTLNAIDQQFGRQGFTNNPRFDSNRVGGNIGGPVLKNRWFYFFDYEYSPTGQAASSSSAIFAPTAAGLATLDAMSGINKNNLNVFKTYTPVAAAQFGNRTTTVNGVAIPLGVLSIAAPSFINIQNYIASSDFNLSEHDQIRARYLYSKQDQIDTTANLPQFFTPLVLRNHLASLSEFHTFTPNITNELRLAYNRRVADNPVGSYSFPGLDVFPNLNFSDLGLNIGPNGNDPQGSRSNTFQAVDNITWTHGRHTFKFGYDGRKLNITSFFVQRQRGDYQYSTLARFLNDITPEFAERSVGGFPFIGNLVSHYAYANDDFKVTSHLTVNLGVRYEFVDVPTGAKEQKLNALASVPGLISFNSPKPTYNDWAPRVGIAYSPGTSGKTSIRAGFGMAYDQIYQNLGTNSLAPEFFTTIDAHITQPGAPNFLANGGIPGTALPLTSPTRARALTSSFIPDQLRPYSIQWNFGVQHVLANDYTIEVRYLGARGVHLPFQVQLNRPAAVTAANSLPTFLSRPTQAQLDALPNTLTAIRNNAPVSPLTAAGFASTITTFEPEGNSTYHGLATQITKRFSKGLQFIGAYTWSHNIDDSTAALFSTVTSPRRPQDFDNLRPERASSALDHRNRFSMSWIYDAPWFKNANWFEKNLIGNWVFGGTYIAETGTWATPRSGIDSNLNGDNAGDRTVINPSGLGNRGSDITTLTNTSGAVVGYLANDPTARYIKAGAGVLPTAGRNTLRLPGINNFDLSLAKRFNFTERKALEFRAEAYNALNHPQYTPGFPSVANLRSRTAGGAVSLLLPDNPIFDRPDLAYQSNSRLMQLVMRFTF